ncbi:MAG TPA: hypothetical protein VFG50_06735 [Rhodothermales bacterium]|nr:hypothetical protein [Rhodothermales bacterium]
MSDRIVPSSIVPRLGAVDGVVRWFLTAFLVTITAGYATGVYFVSVTTHGSVVGTVHEFRGNEEVPLEEAREIKYAKDTMEMLNVIHAHVTSFALIYLAVGAIFLCSSYPPGLKGILAVEPFAATLILFGGMAALRYLGSTAAGAFAGIMMLAGFSTFGCFLIMVALSLWEMWRPQKRG